MRTPDLEGPAGRAWEIDVADDPNRDLNPLSYLIEAPGQSAFWRFYMLALVDLEGRAADGTEAVRDFPDARWEIMAFALYPEHEYDPDAFEAHPLFPQNVRVQIPDHPAELVVSTLTVLAQVVVAGGLAIEPPFSTSNLTEVWRSTIEATLEHPHHGGNRQ